MRRNLRQFELTGNGFKRTVTNVRGTKTSSSIHGRFRKIVERQRILREYAHDHLLSDSDLIAKIPSLGYHNVEAIFRIRGKFNLLENYLSDESKLEYSEPKLVQLNNTIRITNIIKGVYENNDLLYKIEPRDFEYLSAELLESKGLKVELTKASRDGGYDLIAIQDTGLTLNRYLVECKRNRQDRPVGVNIVRSLGYVLDRNIATKAMIFTTSYFSPDAIKERELIKYRMDLKDGQDILKWIQEYVILK